MIFEDQTTVEEELEMINHTLKELVAVLKSIDRKFSEMPDEIRLILRRIGS